ncbi:MAG: TRAM domain-containing protein [Planctomycetes bacterium]|nr:TRAM domain-containing protein [Planctomycetota bacterium]MBI3833333.1 TRAM domain-containing protein [Planctomycetota bacterium]
MLRVVFVLTLAAVGMSLAADPRLAGGAMAGQNDVILIAFIGGAMVVTAFDILVPRKSLTAISGLFFGLVVGMVVAYGLSLIVDLVGNMGGDLSATQSSFIRAIKLGIGVTCCYLAVSFVLQTKDDVRFVIPYVEFSKDAKGARPLVLDTSVIVDGRIADIANTRIIETEMIVPRFVLLELQTIADSGDKLKRVRGRRGLDVLNKLQTNENIEIRMLDTVPLQSAAGAGVDEMLVDLALQLNGRVVTNDYNLNKIAQLRGVSVININDLANALKPVVLPGEMLTVKMVKPGEEMGQGIGYLEDGTMVVAEGGRERLGDMVDITVTSVLQTSAGRMIFGRADGAVPADRRRPRPQGSP